MQHTLATGRAATLLKLAFAAGAKLSAAFIAFGLTALVTRNVPNDEAGIILSGLIIHTVFFVVRLCPNNVVLRFLSDHGLDEYRKEKLNKAILWAITVSIPLTSLSMIFVQFIAGDIFNKPEFWGVLFWMLPALPAIALFYLFSFAYQSRHKVILGTLVQNLGVLALLVVGLVYIWYDYTELLGVALLTNIHSAAAQIVLVLAFILWFRQNNVGLRYSGYKDGEMTSEAMDLWTASLMTLSVHWVRGRD